MKYISQQDHADKSKSGKLFKVAYDLDTIKSKLYVRNCGNDGRLVPNYSPSPDKQPIDDVIDFCTANEIPLKLIKLPAGMTLLNVYEIDANDDQAVIFKIRFSDNIVEFSLAY